MVRTRVLGLFHLPFVCDAYKQCNDMYSTLYKTLKCTKRFVQNVSCITDSITDN
ncbi:hypothetical protein PR003_g21102 [Phytophthora rubi]|uniref:Uncharacterized protein n=1 Tax=Phytophthora rubi TaxID=129364 RepID=A0A6A3JJJ9_9STRA|nr:hypothetical protein PR002_g20493 [Phytophthora rubi]KAE9307033.1 hypothetical protein PR003_g21102 [Phytophthora rubi]